MGDSGPQCLHLPAKHHCIASCDGPSTGSRELPAHSLCSGSNGCHARPTASVRACHAAGVSESRIAAMACGRLRVDHPKRMLSLGADLHSGLPNRIIQSTLQRIRQNAAPSWSPGDAEADPPAMHLGSLLNPVLVRIRIDHALLAVQEISGWVEIMPMGSHDVQRVDKATRISLTRLVPGCSTT
jgi:hypothetical protein